MLAAGGSSRMGRPKQLLDFGGAPLLRRAVETALASDCAPIVVVLGFGAPEIAHAIEGLQAKVVVNAAWPLGVGTSIRAGLSALQGSHVTGAILALADQPFVNASHLRRLVATHYATGKSIVASRYSDTVGVPAFFAPSQFSKLMELPPDRGCKGVITGNLPELVVVECAPAAFDIDTPADYSLAVRTRFRSSDRLKSIRSSG